jgi:cell division protein WhiA
MYPVSFSFNVREEISRNTPERQCCREAMLAGILFSSYSRKEQKEKLVEITTGLSRGARLIYKLIKETAGESVHWETNREKFLLKRNVYHIFIPDTPEMREYATRWGVADKLHKKNIRKACCRRAFLAGSFLASGSVNSPDGRYHFEIVQKESDISRILVQILARMEITAKITRRRGKHVVYVKKADEIANILNILGAHTALLKFEEVRVIKETKKEVRRKVNSETSNMDKRARAATRQIHLIHKLREAGILTTLPEFLQVTAELRLQYPESSLQELGERFLPPITKSSVNSRLRRLEAVAKKLK